MARAWRLASQVHPHRFLMRSEEWLASRLTRTLIAFLVPLASMVSSCAKAGSYLLTQDVSGRPVRIPIVALDRVSQTAVLDREAMHDAGFTTIWPGMSGTPVVASGEVVGYLCWTRRIEGPGATLGYLSAVDFDTWAGLASVHAGVAPEVASRRAMCGSSKASAVDGLVTTAYVWGDVVCGPSGTMSGFRPGIGKIYAHGFALEGATNLAILRSRPLCFTRSGPLEDTVVRLEAGRGLGRTLWTGACGAIALLDGQCPGVAVEVLGSNRWWRGEGPESAVRMFCARQDSADIDPCHWPVVGAVASRLDGAAADTRFDVRVGRLGGADECLRMTVPEFDDWLRQTLTTKTEVERVTVSVPEADGDRRMAAVAAVGGLVSNTALPCLTGVILGRRRVLELEPAACTLAIARSEIRVSGTWRDAIGGVAMTDHGPMLVDGYVGALDNSSDRLVFSATPLGRRSAPAFTGAGSPWLRIGGIGGEMAEGHGARVIFEDDEWLVGVCALPASGLMMPTEAVGLVHLYEGAAAWRPVASGDRPALMGFGLAATLEEPVGRVVRVDGPYVLVKKRTSGERMITHRIRWHCIDPTGIETVATCVVADPIGGPGRRELELLAGRLLREAGCADGSIVCATLFDGAEGAIEPMATMESSDMTSVDATMMRVIDLLIAAYPAGATTINLRFCIVVREGR
jgi:hypothetical protein